MQSEEAVQVDRGVRIACLACGPRDRDRRPQVVVGLLAVRHHDVEAVRRAALENRDQNFLARARRAGGVQGALQPLRRGAHAHHGEGRIA